MTDAVREAPLRRGRKRAVPPGMTIGRCHFSVTGWALWECKDGSPEPWRCTCRPAQEPAAAVDQAAKDARP